MTGEGLPAFGTQVLMNVINEVGALPTRNHTGDVQFEGRQRTISAEAMAEPRKSDGKPNLVTNAACFGCTIACGRVSTVDRTHYTVKDRPEYQKASGGLEYEAAWALGAATGVGDLDALTFANFICNEQGMDPISFGATVGAAMELYEDRRHHRQRDRWCRSATSARPKALTDLGRADRQGRRLRCKEIGLGSKLLCEKYGQARALHVGQGPGVPGLRFSRGIQGMGLTYATSNRGACHLRSLHGGIGDPRHPGEDRSAWSPTARRGW